MNQIFMPALSSTMTEGKISEVRLLSSRVHTHSARTALARLSLRSPHTPSALTHKLCSSTLSSLHTLKL